ncbi:MAG: acyl-ACP--UDP-N-acetylglucosamine O-acyltransferase [Elusimicrobiaceae bacterium]|nr:acyl-ACP--UDP-N-acetylglucosamine O-acyltransferase [Elusimicrobiaceae bacterium]
MSNIHPTAIIDKSAKLHESVKVEPYAIIGKNATIKANNIIGPFCIIENADIDEGNEFLAHVCVGTPPQDFGYDKNLKTMVKIGKNNIFRENFTVHRSTKVDTPTTIGSGGMFMANAHIGHDCKVGDKVVMVNATGLSGHVEIEDNVVLSGLIGVHQFCRIGKMTMVSGGAMVVLDIPPYCRAQGDRVKLAGLNLVGLKRNGFSRETILEIKDVYKQLFLDSGTLKDKISQLENQKLGKEAMEMVKFCKDSKRGIASARGGKNE